MARKSMATIWESEIQILNDDATKKEIEMEFVKAIKENNKEAEDIIRHNRNWVTQEKWNWIRKIERKKGRKLTKEEMKKFDRDADGLFLNMLEENLYGTHLNLKLFVKKNKRGIWQFKPIDWRKYIQFPEQTKLYKLL